MFCQNCGNHIEDNAKFCPSCGQPNQSVQPAAQSPMQQFNFQNMNQSLTPQTNYASTSFHGAIWGLVLILLCGIGLLIHPFSLTFGILALKNKEPETLKAWIGIVISAFGILFLLIIIYRWITGEV